MDLLEELIGQTLDEKYRIHKQLGQGGMGAVYHATHLGTGRPVALKVIAPGLMDNPEAVERFKREAQAAGLLRHPNIVDVTDFGFAHLGPDRIAYLVMEYLEGISLGDILKEEKLIPLAQVVDILEQVCLAVERAHERGIIHRDLKPDNIWLEPNDRGGFTVKVLDFGIAHIGSVEQPPSNDEETILEQTIFAPTADGVERVGFGATDPIGEAVTFGGRAEQVTEVRGLTKTGALMGTPSYMSPEQCLGRTLTRQSDIYSLGVVAYEMLAGEKPFQGSLYNLISQHTEASPLPIRYKNSKIPKRVEKVVMSALAKNINERPTSAAGFANALRANTQTTGLLFRRAFALYMEHFPQFFRVAFLAYLPLIALHGALLIIGVLNQGASNTQTPDGGVQINSTPDAGVQISSTSGSAIEIALSIMAFFVNFFTNVVVIGVTIRLVTQLFLAPLRPLQLRTAAAAVRRRLKPLLTTTAIASIRSLLGLLLLIPGVIMFINYSLAAPVVMMEGLKGRAALKRSKELVKQSRRTVIVILFFQWLIPVFISAIVGGELGMLLRLSDIHQAEMLAGRITSIIVVMLNTVIVPLIATMTALLYLKARQLSGETIKEALGQFEEEDGGRPNWQVSMSRRLQTTPKH